MTRANSKGRVKKNGNFLWIWRKGNLKNLDIKEVVSNKNCHCAQSVDGISPKKKSAYNVDV